jgi:heme exporter protein D
MPWNCELPLMVLPPPVMLTVTFVLLACSRASELVSVKPLTTSMVTVEPDPAAATAATAVFQSVWLATSMAMARVAHRLAATVLTARRMRSVLRSPRREGGLNDAPTS